jgi:hypothetical protein
MAGFKHPIIHPAIKENYPNKKKYPHESASIPLSCLLPPVAPPTFLLYPFSLYPITYLLPPLIRTFKLPA